MFSFTETANSSQSTGGNALEGNKIHDVIFEEAVVEDVQGKQDPTAVYKVIKLKFKNDEGSYEHAIFEPNRDRGDFDRGVREFVKDGKTQTMPTASNVESMMLLLKHAIDAIRPEVGEKINKGEVKLEAKNWNDLRNNVATILNKGKGVSTKIKLLTNNKGYSKFPGFFTGINQEGKAYIRNNFIGNKLGFTPYETSRMTTMATAKPTNMSLEPEPSTDLSDINDFEIADL